MFLFRSFTVGLIGACCLLLATRPQTAIVLANPSPQLVMMAEPPACDAARGAPGVTVIDVAPSVTGELLAQLIALAANERINAIDEVSVRDGHAALRARVLDGRQYLDVQIASDAVATRRVLVLAAR
jgi:hypothetical protein